jgi:3'-phosphoadenosine 5'-phosphosulfate sulfotransferase (PAPS reductase)/FAD synthetase
MCWDYIRTRQLPYNPLHDQGYASIGDTHSTQPGEGRSGRWAGTDKTECGIHTVAADDVKELLGAPRLEGGREAETPASAALEQKP